MVGRRARSSSEPAVYSGNPPRLGELAKLGADRRLVKGAGRATVAEYCSFYETITA